jgi:YegS/Rv2252/BmrU family lipid kinase
MKALLIYNPQAGHRRAKKLLPYIESLFAKHKIDFDLHLTDYPEHGIEIVGRVNFNTYDCLVAAGGDGTLFEVINGYYKNKSTRRIPLGILPIGTGNAFARDLELDNAHVEDAIKVIGNQNLKKVDVGYFKTHGQEYYFLNILGIGFVADVTETAHKLKLFGNLSYTLGVFYRTIFLKSNHVIVDMDGQKIERDTTFIEISNTRYTANFLMAPNAKIDDGLLDVTLAGKFNRTRLMQCFPKIFTGEHIYLDEVETFQASQIKILTDVSKVLTPDGELIGITPVEIICLPRAIEVFWK